MNHSDHVALIKGGLHEPGGVWADMGAGSGAFTAALADLLEPGATLIAVDKQAREVEQQTGVLARRHPDLTISWLAADFTRPLDLSPLDGIVMANALHFVREKAATVAGLRGQLRPNGRFILVEYNVDRGNHWVPHPLSYDSWVTLAKQAGFSQTRFLDSRPSRFLREIYSAVSW